MRSLGVVEKRPVTSKDIQENIKITGKDVSLIVDVWMSNPLHFILAWLIQMGFSMLMAFVMTVPMVMLIYGAQFGTIFAFAFIG